MDNNDNGNLRGDDDVEDHPTLSALHNNQLLERVGGRGGFEEGVEASCGRLMDELGHQK